MSLAHITAKRLFVIVLAIILIVFAIVGIVRSATLFSLIIQIITLVVAVFGLLGALHHSVTYLRWFALLCGIFCGIFLIQILVDVFSNSKTARDVWESIIICVIYALGAIFSCDIIRADSGVMYPNSGVGV